MMKAPDVRRLGIMVPSVNVVLEEDVPKHLPTGIMAHYTRVKLSANTEAEIAGMIDYIPRAAADLADAHVDVIGFACTGGSVIGGAGYDERITAAIMRETGTPATTTASAIVAGLRQLGATAIALGTPYEPWLNAREVTFFEQSGFRIVRERGLGVPNPSDCQRVTGAEIRELARSIDSSDAEAIVLSCANFRAWDVVEAIEQELGKPVVTSNQAIVWHMMQRIGLSGIKMDRSALWRANRAARVPA
jgi:maleate cis-trans isomerase